MEGDERALVRQCLAGDQDACARLVETHARMVGTVIWRATGDSAAVEDLAQETFLRVFRALSYFDAQAKLSTWIYTIAHRVAIDHLRRTGRCREESLTPTDDSETGVLSRLQTSVVNPERALVQQEAARLVHDGLAQLPDKYRLALVYTAIEELDYPTVAAMLGIPLGTVKTLIFRGKRLLKDRILMEMDKRNEVSDAL